MEEALSEPDDDQPLQSRRFELRARSHTTSNKVPPTSTLAKSMPTPAPPVPQVVPPARLLNRPRGSFIPSWVREFYTTYDELVPKRKNKAGEFRPIKSVTVRGVEVSCNDEHINDVLDRPPGSARDMKGVEIKKKDLNIAARCWFEFSSSSLMPSQNKSILRHAKAACLGSILSKRRLNLSLIIEQEMAMRAKQKQISFPFPVLIRELCKHAGVPRDVASEFDVTLSSSTGIRCIEAEYTREEADRKRIALVDTSPKVDVNSIPIEASLPTPTSESSERSIPLMIEVAILAAMIPLQTSIDTFTMRVKACESRYGETSEISALKAKVPEFRKDVDYLKSTDFTLLLEAVDNLDAPKTLEIPSATAGDVPRDKTIFDESDAETDEEQIAIRDKSIYRDLPNLGEMIIQSVIQTSRIETSMEAPSGSGTAVSSEATLGTDAQVHTDAPGTDS
ncbi:hypothetical protein H5410_027782 [Solanum commersonii]|uniref:Putative plant transposon protein domain-containing protein n=1 Tax=Solanum commersonii TaxID=4109 RepID=A0A9J5Z0T8_SOLCO|nr:hypothetical protein H5410_027782 [Solanum commersonii]